MWTDHEQSTGMGHVACTSSNRYVIISMKCTFILPPPLLYTRHSRSAASIHDTTETTLQVPKVKCHGSTPMYGEHSELVPCGDKHYSIILIVNNNFARFVHNWKNSWLWQSPFGRGHYVQRLAYIFSEIHICTLLCCLCLSLPFPPLA